MINHAPAKPMNPVICFQEEVRLEAPFQGHIEAYAGQETGRQVKVCCPSFTHRDFFSGVGHGFI